MEVLRIKLTQNKANYRKEQSVINKMTYPLPPFSTVIGAIHVACGWTHYHPMNLSIQGKYQSMQKEVYTDHGFLNSVMDDRGILVKLKNGQLLSTAYDVVAKAKKSQGNSFRYEKTIDVINPSLLAEYQQLKDKKDQLAEEKKQVLDPQMKQYKDQIKQWTAQQKELDKKAPEYATLQQHIAQAKQQQATLENDYKMRKSHIEQRYEQFASLTTSVRYYEVLYGVELVLHIQADAEVLQEIIDHVYDIKSLGRSEDFVDVTDVAMVKLQEDIQQKATSQYGGYIDYQRIKTQDIMLRQGKKNISTPAQGTLYYLNKTYQIVNKKRVFDKVPVVYVSGYHVGNRSKHVYIDQDGHIVNLI